MSGIILRRQGFFDPLEAMRLEIMETADCSLHIPLNSRSQDVKDQLDLFADHLAHSSCQLKILAMVQPKYRFRSLPPSSLHNAVTLISKPAEFFDGPIQVLHIKMDGSHGTYCVMQLST